MIKILMEAVYLWGLGVFLGSIQYIDLASLYVLLLKGKFKVLDP